MSGEADIGRTQSASANIVPFGRARPKADVQAVNQMQPLRQPPTPCLPNVRGNGGHAICHRHATDDDHFADLDTVAVAELLRIMPLYFLNLCATLVDRNADGASEAIAEAKSAMRAMLE